MTADRQSATKREIDELGERLRAASSIAEIHPDDQALLHDVLRECDAAKAEVERRIRETFPRLEPTSRTKTSATIHEKLRRQQHLRLSELWDLAGTRLIVRGTRTDLERVVQQLQSLFPGARRIDRIAHPSHGYRAVHLIATVGRCQVEIQVRTELQNLWAQAVERLADIWGRQIRYGGEPTDPDREVVGGRTRRDYWRLVLRFSDIVANLEEGLVRVRQIRSDLAGEPLHRALRYHLQLLRLQVRMWRSEREVRRALVAFRRWAANELLR